MKYKWRENKNLELKPNKQHWKIKIIVIEESVVIKMVETKGEGDGNIKQIQFKKDFQNKPKPNSPICYLDPICHALKKEV